MTLHTAVLIGAGRRGTDILGGFAERFPDDLRFVAVAEANEARRNAFARAHGIAPEACFASYEELLSRPAFAPLCFIATNDAMHRDAALAALDAGYHLFLEKPMATAPGDCLRIERKARELGRMVQIAHPLRHTPFYLLVKRILEEKRIGRPISFILHENVGYWHFAHSYVRGNWRREDESGPLLLTKCCHDMDLAIWLAGEPISRVASVGSRKMFIKENAPPGATRRCMDGCPAQSACPFYAPAMYLTPEPRWPANVPSVDTSLEARRQAIERGPYGNCVFLNDNTVVDHQLVIGQFESGASLHFAVEAGSYDCFRTIRIIGTEGELNGHLEKSEIAVLRFVKGRPTQARPEVFLVKVSEGDEHSGGDEGAIRTLLRRVDNGDFAAAAESLHLAVEGHLLAFAGEEARKAGQMIAMNEYRMRSGRSIVPGKPEEVMGL